MPPLSHAEKNSRDPAIAAVCIMAHAASRRVIVVHPLRVLSGKRTRPLFCAPAAIDQDVGAGNEARRFGAKDIEQAHRPLRFFPSVLRGCLPGTEHLCLDSCITGRVQLRGKRYGADAVDRDAFDLQVRERVHE